MKEAVDEKQIDRFKKIARMIEADESEANWDKRLKKVAKPKPEKPQK
ncbi:MAG: hypothetical protein V3V15_08750 [Sphingorhabdus sp.]